MILCLWIKGLHFVYLYILIICWTIFFVRHRILEKLEVKEFIYIYCFTFTHQLLTWHAMLACHIGPRMKLSSNRKFEDETGQFHSWGTNLSPRQKLKDQIGYFAQKKQKNKQTHSSFFPEVEFYMLNLWKPAQTVPHYFFSFSEGDFGDSEQRYRRWICIWLLSVLCPLRYVITQLAHVVLFIGHLDSGLAICVLHYS